LAAQGLAAQGLQGLAALQGLVAAQGLHGMIFFLAAQGLQGLQAFFAAQGLQGLQAATCTEVSAAWAAASGRAAVPAETVATLKAIRVFFNMSLASKIFDLLEPPGRRSSCIDGPPDSGQPGADEPTMSRTARKHESRSCDWLQLPVKEG
jgi:hypothetical protein